jgi:ATP-binding cassette subfamily B protein
MSDHPIILLDEPTSALDQTNATEIILELSHLAKNQNKTIVTRYTYALFFTA